MAIGTTNISISAINTENTATTSNSLKTLSETAVEGLSTLNEAPYAMSEFQNYSHVFSTNYSLYTTNSGGKANIDRNHMSLTDSTWPIGADGSDWTVSISSAAGGQTGITLNCTRSGNHSSGSTYPNSWVSVVATGTNSWTLARSVFDLWYSNYNSSNNTTYVYFRRTETTTRLNSSGSGTITLNV
jgi:hypothetical protein